MKPEIKKLWVEALRSGDYKQGRSRLRDENNRFCCLGVLCNIYAQQNPEFAANQKYTFAYDGLSGFPSYTVREWAGLKDEDPTVYVNGIETSLSIVNDMHNFNFKQIARLIEKQL
jgi:hypothetical protein